MSNIAVIGSEDFVMAFKTLGLLTVAASDAKEAGLHVVKLAEKCPVIFVESSLAQHMEETLQRYQRQPYPAIIPLPGSRGDGGFALSLLKKNVEKAVGVDILFGKEEKE